MSLEPSTKPLTVTIKRAGELLGVSRQTIHRAITAGNLRTIRLGGRVLVDYGSLEAIVNTGVRSLPASYVRTGCDRLTR